MDDFGRNVRSAIRHHWVLFLIPGIVMAILGLLAAAAPFIATPVVETFAGWLFLTGGFVGLAALFTTRNVPGFVWTSSAPRWKRIAFMFLLSGVLGCLPARGHTAGLDCPEMGPGGVPNLLTDAQVKLVASGNSVDVANEINDLINKLQTEKPNISYAELTDVLLAAYCPAVANMANLTVSERWRRMRQFDTILQQQLAANMMPPGSLVIANVPLPPAVYRTLRAQAAASGQDPAQLMAAILSRAAGK